MSEQELRDEVTALRAVIETLRREVLSLIERVGFDGRLGPPRETQEDIDRRAARLAETIDRIRRDATGIAAAVNPPPVDRSALCTTDGRPPADARASQTNETGQHPSYLVLCDAERAKGFARPYRDRYKHTTCGGVTTMGRALSETYARDPTFYGATFCVTCDRHLPVAEFTWTADGAQVGS